MSWRRGKAYGQDLRDRVLAATGRLREVAERFGLSQAYVSRVRSRHERLGQASAGAQHNQQDIGPAGADAKKKTVHASEQKRSDVAQARTAWSAEQAWPTSGRLIFLD